MTTLRADNIQPSYHVDQTYSKTTFKIILIQVLKADFFQLFLGLLIATVNGSGLPGFFSLTEDSPMEDNGDLCQKQVRQMAIALKSCYENPISSNDMNYNNPIGRIPRGKRSPGCMQRCVTGGMLHPAQCHSLC